MSEKLYEHAKAMYGDEEIAQHVYEDAEAKGHTEKILSGELQLPHPADARKWVDHKLGRDNETPSERDAQRKIRELETKLQQITGEKES